MSDELSSTIEVLTGRVRAKEDEINSLKRLVNALCVEAGLDARYPVIGDNAAGSAGIRADEFYGQTLTAAVRNYLEKRKAGGFGAANLPEIYRAIKDGGYKFDTANEANQKVSVGNALRKTSSIFHRLPNGQYGLLSWYPGAKEKAADETLVKKKKARKTDSLQPHSGEGAKADRVTQREVTEVVLAQTGDFKTSDIAAAVKSKFPLKDLPVFKVPTIIFQLKKRGLVKEVSPRNGSIPAVFVKV